MSAFEYDGGMDVKFLVEDRDGCSRISNASVLSTFDTTMKDDTVVFIASMNDDSVTCAVDSDVIVTRSVLDAVSMVNGDVCSGFVNMAY